jgi:hypothetical protein
MVFFPSGIYAISATLNLKTATEYRGPRGGTVFQGTAGPQSGYGAALKWIGGSSNVIVNIEGTYKSVWDGIDIFGYAADDTKAELTSRNLTGIRLHSDNDPSSQMNRISNINIWNCNVGIRVGGLDAASYTYQTDGWVIEKFWIYIVNTGIYINGGNASQYSTIRNGSIWQFDAGLYLYETSYMGIEDVFLSSMESPVAGEANIIIRVPNSTLTIARTQGEPHTGTTWPHIRFTAGLIYSPVTLISNHFDGALDIANAGSGQNVLSMGNTFNDNVNISGNDVIFTSINDHFFGSSGGVASLDVGIMDTGINNHITEQNVYYDQGCTTTPPGPIEYRRKFNNIVKEYRRNNTVDLRSNGLTTLTADSATPSVLNGDFFTTANTVPTTYTNFTDGVEGQNIWILANDNNTTIDFSGSSINGNTGVDNTLSPGDHISCRKAGNYWYCLLGKIS